MGIVGMQFVLDRERVWCVYAFIFRISYISNEVGLRVLRASSWPTCGRPPFACTSSMQSRISKAGGPDPS